jgi:hypothetical protein
MKLFPPPLVVGNTEGFTAENDLFGRKPIAEGMTNLLTKVSSPLTVAVDGQWGSGKTVFLKMWAGELRKQNIPVAYFDAFANDHNEDAFSAIAQALISLARSSEPKVSAATRSFVAASGGIARLLAKGAFKTALRVASQGIVDDQLLQSWTKTVEDQASNVTDELVDRLLREQEAKDQLMTQFREALVRLPLVLTQLRNPEAKSAPLVIIIDELDRCRPTFAIQVLESIKHFFSVERTHFVLGLHTEQLQHSIKAVYGPEIDAARYLEKFIHLSVFLTEEKRAYHKRDVVKYVEHWKRNLEFSPTQTQAFDEFSGLVVHVAETQALPIRSVERVLSNLTLALIAVPESSLRLHSLIAGLSVLKALYPGLYNKAKAGSLSYQEAAAALSLSVPASSELETWVAEAERWWKHVLNDNADETVSHVLRRHFGGSSNNALPAVATQVLDFWSERSNTGR